MALNAYMKLTGQKQGQIKGSVTQKGREDSILVHAYSHDLEIATDLAAGAATGRRQHKPIVITKEADKSSPPLRTAWSTNENLTEVVLQFWEPNIKAGVAGTEVQFFTVKLTNAHIVSIRSLMPDNQDPDLAKLAIGESVSFIYQKIEWTWTDGGITWVDQWDSKL